MEQAAIFVFWASVLFILYVLLGYPALLGLLAFRARTEIRRAWVPRTVSIIIPVHNGESWIPAKLETIRSLDYPADLIRVIFIDDGSTDRTAELLTQLGDARIQLLSLPRSGKAAALNAGLNVARGEILFFTDIRQRLDRGSLRSLMECFADPSIGVVSGELIIESGKTEAEANVGLYWRYEKWIRKRLSRLDSVLGATGCLYAMRRELAVPLPSRTILDDVHLPLAAFFKGYRIIFDDRAVAFDRPTALGSEFRRKVRTQAGVYQIAMAYPRLLLPTTRMWLHFCSHKLGRLLAPFALLSIAISSLALPPVWRVPALVLQVGFYGLAALDRWMPRPINRVSSLARTFVVLMSAALCAPIFLATAHRRGPGWSTSDIRPAVAPPRVQPR